MMKPPILDLCIAEKFSNYQKSFDFSLEMFSTCFNWKWDTSKMDEPELNVSKSKDNISIVHDLIERSPDGDGDESDKHI